MFSTTDRNMRRDIQLGVYSKNEHYPCTVIHIDLGEATVFTTVSPIVLYRDQFNG
jgi:hypothetical protein